MSASDLELCQASSKVYSAMPQASATRCIGDVVFETSFSGLTPILAFRGSVTAEDWMKDAEGWPVWDADLGLVHSGFLEGMHAVADFVIAKHNAESIALTGHSLGGARARILAALLIIKGAPPAKVCTFGSPRPGFANISRVIQKSGIEHVSYHNRNDPVPYVPGLLPQWCHPEEWIQVDQAAAVNAFDPLRDHSIALYLKALSKETA